jgi:hypothetical protein
LEVGGWRLEVGHHTTLSPCSTKTATSALTRVKVVKFGGHKCQHTIGEALRAEGAYTLSYIAALSW